MEPATTCAQEQVAAGSEPKTTCLDSDANIPALTRFGPILGGGRLGQVRTARRAMDSISVVESVTPPSGPQVVWLVASAGSVATALSVLPGLGFLTGREWPDEPPVAHVGVALLPLVLPVRRSCGDSGSARHGTLQWVEGLRRTTEAGGARDDGL
jgi:hypothetical protein